MIKDTLCYKRSLLCAGILLGLVNSTGSWAGAILDGTTGSTGSFTNAMVIPETVGDAVGTNLFHSFSDFNINTGESATFTSTSSFNNVISRVTGSGTSTFNGPLISSITGANFYFMNPNGVVFQEGAQITVDGSFYATTSDYIRLGQDGVVYANASTPNTLTSSTPSAFGFLDSNPGGIALEGAQLLKGFSLVQPDGATFSLVGGDITLDQAAAGTTTQYGTTDSRGSFISATGNRFEMVSVASAGEAVSVSGGYDLSSFNTLGDVEIAGGSVVDATDVYIRGGNVVIQDSVIAPGFFYLPYYYADLTGSYGLNVLGGAFPAPGGPSIDNAPDGGSIDIDAVNQVTINGTAALQIPVVFPGFEFMGPLALPRPSSESYLAGITVFGGTPTTSFSGVPATDVADISISGGTVSLSGTAGIISERYGTGLAGDINITADTVDVRNGAFVANINTYIGTGGNITVNAEQLILDGEDDATGLTGLNASSTFGVLFGAANHPLFFNQNVSYGDAGVITVNATGAGLAVSNGASISTESRALGSAGNIVINASDINLSRDNAIFGAIASQSSYAGNAGDINIHATGDINITSGFEITGSVQGIGNGGSISVTADNAINISAENTGIASATTQPSSQVKDDLANLYAAADFDQLLTFLVNGSGALPADSNMFDALAALEFMGLLDLNGSASVAGNAGNISVNSSALNLSNASRITSSSTTNGNGGLIDIQIDTLAISSNAEIRSRSGLINEVTSLLEVGAGTGGDITITATESVSMTGGASISSSSKSTTGDAGAIIVDAGNTLDMTDSSITTEATDADGGDITLRAIKRIYLDNSNITTSVNSGTGAGGNIDIDPEFVILKSSNILANAYGGPGGNITIVADNFLNSPDSVIDASSALSQDGTVNISSPDEDVSDDLAVLPDNYLDVTSLIGERCGVASGSSGLVNAGPGGMSVDPDGYLPSFAVANLDDEESTTKVQSANAAKHWSDSYLAQSRLDLAQVSCNIF